MTRPCRIGIAAMRPIDSLSNAASASSSSSAASQRAMKRPPGTISASSLSPPSHYGSDKCPQNLDRQQGQVGFQRRPNGFGRQPHQYVQDRQVRLVPVGRRRLVGERRPLPELQRDAAPGEIGRNEQCPACVWRITDFPKNPQFATHSFDTADLKDAKTCSTCSRAKRDASRKPYRGGARDLPPLNFVHFDSRGPLGGAASLDACPRSSMIAGISSPKTSPRPKAIPSQMSSSLRSGRGAWA